MKLYTVQMAQHRKVTEMGLEIFDITMKSGERKFAPTWSMIKKYKDSDKGEAAQAEYTEQYRDLMNRSYRFYIEYWQELCRRETLVLACYCPAGEFCHRHILKQYIEKVCNHLNIPFEYAGEIQ